MNMLNPLLVLTSVCIYTERERQSEFKRINCKLEVETLVNEDIEWYPVEGFIGREPGLQQ